MISIADDVVKIKYFLFRLESRQISSKEIMWSRSLKMTNNLNVKIG